MTLTETEETIQTLINRHPGLDESMLVTLLRAGGWEEKEIQEARTLFAQRGGTREEHNETLKNLPTIEERVEFPAQADSNHLLAAAESLKKEIKPVEAARTEKVSEPQSLNYQTESSVRSKRDELPHDLPLRPFETSDHIWPFSRYKDVFYGDTPETPKEILAVVTPPAPPVTPIIQKEKEEIKPVPIAVPKSEAPSFIREGFRSPPEAKKANSLAVPEKGDEKLVFIAGTMLIAILFVLGYMYSNGRL